MLLTLEALKEEKQEVIAGYDKKISALETVLAMFDNGEQVKQKGKKPRTRIKNPDAVALGRLGGLKGGKARTEKLTPEQRSDIAKKGAEKRWGKKSNNVEIIKDEEKQLNSVPKDKERKINYDDMA